jgi:hypothetical protein
MSHTAHTYRIGPEKRATGRSAVRAPAHSGRTAANSEVIFGPALPGPSVKTLAANPYRQRTATRLGKIAAPPILFDSKTNSTGRMWSEDDVEAARAALKAASANS